MEYRFQIFALVCFLMAGCSRGPKVCEVCHRDECKAMAFRITLESGKTVETCCPRCGMHYLESTRQAPRRLEVTDFATGHWMEATQAVFVSGSDFHGCAMPETRRDAQGCCLMKAYDRCLPSLVVFADKSVAVEFQKQHGGELLASQELLGKR